MDFIWICILGTLDLELQNQRKPPQFGSNVCFQTSPSAASHFEGLGRQRVCMKLSWKRRKISARNRALEKPKYLVKTEPGFGFAAAFPLAEGQLKQVLLGFAGLFHQCCPLLAESC